VEKCVPASRFYQRAKQDRNETAGRRMQGLTISNWPRLGEALASNSMNSRHLTCEKARQQQEAQQRSTLSLQDEPRRLLTRFDTGHLCSTPFPAGWSNSIPALPVSHGSKLSSPDQRHPIMDLGHGLGRRTDFASVMIEAVTTQFVRMHRARSASSLSHRTFAG